MTLYSIIYDTLVSWNFIVWSLFLYYMTFLCHWTAHYEALFYTIWFLCVMELHSMKLISIPYDFLVSWNWILWSLFLYYKIFMCHGTAWYEAYFYTIWLSCVKELKSMKYISILYDYLVSWNCTVWILFQYHMAFLCYGSAQ